VQDVELPGFKIERVIGIGARSRIYEALEEATGNKFAVKRVVRNTPDDDRFIDQVEKEFEVSSRLEHPFLRKSFHLHRLRKRLQTKEVLLVMEYVFGVGLDRQVPNRLHQFLVLFRKVATALNALHEMGYLHADMKPNNILRGPQGLVKIIDFGHACPIGQRKDRIQGTPDYIAPEQVRRLPLDQRTDVFNLGATMYWTLTLENFPTELRVPDSMGGTYLITADRPLAPIEINEKIPVALSKLIMDCCSENPLDRPADMRQLDARLATVQKLWLKQRDKLMSEYRRSLGLPPLTRPAPTGTQGPSLAPPDEPIFGPDSPEEEEP